MAMVKEIGSEFSYEEKQNGHGIKLTIEDAEETFVFSGRTAIETVLKNEPAIHKAMLPSYCCDSMIEPFRRSGIEISFYSVQYENGLHIDINVSEDVDCILWCNYFGFNVPMPDFSQFIKNGGIIMEDITHSLFSVHPFHKQSHYLVASIRKWEPVFCGGYVASLQRKMKYVPYQLPQEQFISDKKKAMKDKKCFLADDSTKRKEEFLELFSKSNSWLAEKYSGLTIDQESHDYLCSVNVKEQINKRKQNARCLYQYLEQIENVECLFDKDAMDCPLFVPVIIRNGKRDYVRKKLIENQIYCPVHWPKPKENGCESNLYDIELSLICDQRYDLNDMKRMISVLKSC